MHMLWTLASDGSVHVISVLQGFWEKLKHEICFNQWLQSDMPSHSESNKVVSSYGHYWSLGREHWYCFEILTWDWSMMKEDIYRKFSEADIRCHKRYMGQNLERRGIFLKLVSHVPNTSSRVNEFRNQYKEYNVPIHDLSILCQGETRQTRIYLASCSTIPLQFCTIPISSYLISQP